MIVKEITKDKITVSFSAIVGKQGLNNIKEYIEFLETAGISKRKKTPKAIIEKLPDEVNKVVFEKFKKAKGYL